MTRLWQDRCDRKVARSKQTVWNSRGQDRGRGAADGIGPQLDSLNADAVDGDMSLGMYSKK